MSLEHAHLSNVRRVEVGPVWRIIIILQGVPAGERRSAAGFPCDEERLDITAIDPAAEVDIRRWITIGEGEVYLAPKGVWHGDSRFIGDDELNECWILDVFSPPREDLRNG